MVALKEKRRDVFEIDEERFRRACERLMRDVIEAERRRRRTNA